jgi:hypothetical protein
LPFSPRGGNRHSLGAFNRTTAGRRCFEEVKECAEQGRRRGARQGRVHGRKSMDSDLRIDDWSAAEIDAVLSAGLRLTGFVEHDVSCWGHLPGMTDLGDGWFGWPEGAPRLPLMFSVRAEKPEN